MADVVVLDYADVIDQNKDLSKQIETAYGYEGLGILLVRGVPDLPKLRQDLLPLAQRFATLPEEVKNKYVHEESHYSFGWSHGKEKFEGAPDFSKGSYYNNPQYDRPVEDEELIKKFSAFCHPNIWPQDDLPQLEHAFKALGRLMVEVGAQLSRHCDKHVAARLPAYKSERLHRIVSTSRTCKARLLHYFPLSEAAAAASTTAAPDGLNTPEAEFSSWCGWHNDHGSLTGLTSAMFLDEKGNEVKCPDPSAGLYIRSRQGQLIKAVIPPDHLAFQIGETAQVHSGGILQATPHCVRGATGPASQGISRETFAVFMEPQWDEPMDAAGVDPQNVLRGSNRTTLPPGVPLLEKRWKPEQDFGAFTEVTLNSYY